MIYSYSEKWLLKINKNINLFSNKIANQHLISSLSFSVELQLIRAYSTVTLALLSMQVEVLLIPNKFWLKKPEDQGSFISPYSQTPTKRSPSIIRTLIKFPNSSLLSYCKFDLWWPNTVFKSLCLILHNF